MKVRIKAPAPLWLHLLATTISGLVWLGIGAVNALMPEFQARPLDPSFPELTTVALGSTLLPRFSQQQPEE